MITILHGDWIEKLHELPDGSVHCCVTSPPYWGLRSYLKDSDPLKQFELGQESTPEEYVAKLVAGFREVWRVLRDDGTLWLNLGDSYASCGGANPHTAPSGTGNNSKSETAIPARTPPKGFKPKDLVGIPWRVALALQADGWYLRSDIIWSKPNPMPESVTDRPTKAHEYIFLVSKSQKYFYDRDAVREKMQSSPVLRNKASEGYHADYPNGDRFSAGERVCGDGFRNKRSVWTVATQPYSEAHFATFPPDLIAPCILAGTSAKGCCPKCGAPWERVVETEYVKHDKWFGDKQGVRNSRGSAGVAYNEPVSTKTIGWHSTCKCNGEEAIAEGVERKLDRAVVLDPFGGSGTTGMVAQELGRRAILIDLNREYIPLIEDRTNVTPGLILA